MAQTATTTTRIPVFGADAVVSSAPLALDLDATIEPFVERALESLDGPAPLLGQMARYHLGQLEADATPASAAVRRASQGKRVRPAVALLCCAAAGGAPAAAAPVAAAIELLHNFTLVHDDIQDDSDRRRHRPTVWKLWGRGQAINAGDALFAAAHLALYGLRETGASPSLCLRLSDAFARTTIEIVEGQVLDLGFEGRPDVSPDDYLDMIARKTAAIVQFAAWSGALLGGADDAKADRFAAFGRALGVGFQTRDDLLGIWGTSEATGKPAADDVRRRKQSLPMLLLRAQSDAATRAELDEIFGQDCLSEPEVSRVVELLNLAGIEGVVEARIRAQHAEARAALTDAAPIATPARRALDSLVDALAERDR